MFLVKVELRAGELGLGGFHTVGLTGNQNAIFCFQVLVGIRGRGIKRVLLVGNRGIKNADNILNAKLLNECHNFKVPRRSLSSLLKVIFCGNPCICIVQVDFLDAIPGVSFA